MSSERFAITVRSRLAAPREAVWRHATSMRGVNAELSPWLRMTVPRRARGRTLDDAPVDGSVFFHSLLLAGGVLPFDRHALRLDRIETGRGFHERSASWMQRAWLHRRSLDEVAPGVCEVVDQVEPSPRLSLLQPLVVRIVRALFEHRHRRLRRIFGSA